MNTDENYGLLFILPVKTILLKEKCRWKRRNFVKNLVQLGHRRRSPRLHQDNFVREDNDLLTDLKIYWHISTPYFLTGIIFIK